MKNTMQTNWISCKKFLRTNIYIGFIILWSAGLLADAHAATYARCMGCHTKKNTGFYISLAQMKKLPVKKIKNAILHGKGNMPAQNVSEKKADQIIRDIIQSNNF